MAEITKSRTGIFLRKIFELLSDKPDGMRAKDILYEVGNSFELTDYESGYYPSSPNYPRYTKIIRFATIALVKAGWLIKETGQWFITDEGKEAFEKYPNPEDFYGEAVRLYREWKKSRKTEEDHIEELEKDDKPYSATLTFEEAEENSWEQIKEHLREINPYDFQDLVAALLKSMDYHISWISPPGKDKGIDIVAYNDPLGTINPRIKVQVKHRMDKTTNVEGLRAFMSVLSKDDVGIFVSSGGFTKDARDEARTQEIRKVTLIDLKQLFELWVEHYLNIDQDIRQLLPLKPIYYLAPEE